ncbi:MAG: hypothetical protein H6725_04015 [Sandaracinaceae bacterium]|nr:hypothetical protein [Sandaracinaceae bacterium]
MTLRASHTFAFALLALFAVSGCDGGGAPPNPDASVMDASAGAPLGASCTAAAGCESGYCVDGVCCESACDGVCESATCGSSGECILADAATVCRAASDLCDVAETCTGTSSACPADLLASAGTECRAAVGVCDLPELCTGSSAACPSDVVVSNGAEVTCRPSAGACDLTETCNGTSTDCPADVLADEETACGTYQCTGSAAACPTFCATHADCATGAMCVSNACLFGRWAFTTSGTSNGNLGGLAGADAFCQGFADAAGLPGTYRAWLSDSTGSPSTRFTQSTIPWVMPVGSNGGVVLADDWADLTDGTIDARFVWTELGAEVNNNIPFTNTTGAGTEWNGNDCSDWTSTAGNGAYGNTGGTDVTWTQSGTGGACNVQHRYYCFQM